ncbi:MAG TPA: lipocalin family protein [Candidatus Limnocylindrales bacterium]|jgi:predicted secreted hydrolase|nr:lipocalin family protein [Candidatus Limnocylindrales bacterium]
MRLLVVGAVVAALLAGCGGGAPILANPPAQRPVATPPPEPSRVVVADPQPVVLPRDDGPHRRLTEWWYYTGHLVDEGGRRWGFEYVIFRVERGRFPVSWAAHLALTDETGGRFRYAQRTEIGRQVDRSGDDGFLELSLSPAGEAAADPDATWDMFGFEDEAGLFARTGPGERPSNDSIGVALELKALKSPALHDTDGWIDLGPAGGSYYYSRTWLTATGAIFANDTTLDVTGTAWFDHQWGDFIAVGGGGWDWFAVNLDDGTDLTLYLVRDGEGGYPLVYGTLVRSDGAVEHLPAEAFSVEVTGRWLSPHTGTDYPAGWQIDLPGEKLVIDLTPAVADQELDTRPTTGVVYWEGSQVVQARRDGRPLGGEAYVELTGYARADTAGD